MKNFVYFIEYSISIALLNIFEEKFISQEEEMIVKFIKSAL